jgi:nucleotide-binding universal stress UspA family protein
MYKKILVAVDLTADTAPIVERAKALAKIHGSDLSLLHVIEPVPLVTPFDVPDVLAPTVLDTQDELAAGARKRLEKIAVDLGVPPSRAEVIVGNTKAEIVRLGLSLGVDYADTTSCYDPAPDGAACGHCDACQLRLKGFAEAGAMDPIRYA